MGTISLEQALTLSVYYHATARYHRVNRLDEERAHECRVNGKVKIWKTRPNEFKLPVKFGFNGHEYITQDTTHWLPYDPTYLEVKDEWYTSTVCAIIKRIRHKWKTTEYHTIPLLHDALMDAGVDTSLPWMSLILNASGKDWIVFLYQIFQGYDRRIRCLNSE